MANRHVEVMRGHGDPQFKHRFEVELPVLSAPDYPVFEDPAKVRSVSERIISIAPLVEYTQEVQSGASANSKWYYFDGDDVSSFTLSFMELQDQLTLDYFLAWRSMQINGGDGPLAGTYNPPLPETGGGYKRTILVKLLSGLDDELRIIKHIGCFPGIIVTQGLDYQSSDAMTIDITVTYDGTETEKNEPNIQGQTVGAGAMSSEQIMSVLEQDGVRNPFPPPASDTAEQAGQPPNPNLVANLLEERGVRIPDFQYETVREVGIPVLSALGGRLPLTAAGAALAALAR